jgi:hypothetical protein
MTKTSILINLIDASKIGLSFQRGGHHLNFVLVAALQKLRKKHARTTHQILIFEIPKREKWNSTINIEDMKTESISLCSSSCKG